MLSARRLSQPGPTVSAFRLPGPSGDPSWFADDMGGAVDPDGPRLSRRDFLIRLAVAAGAVTVGGGVNLLAMTLARRSFGGATSDDGQP